MKIYNTYYKKPNGEEETAEFYNLTAAKKWMKDRPGSTGHITKVYSNGDWEPCGEIVLKGRNSVQMSTQTTATY